MIQLLHNTFVKSALFALLSFVLLFGSLFLGEKNVFAAITGNQALSIINIEWDEASQVSDESFVASGRIVLGGQTQMSTNAAGQSFPSYRFFTQSAYLSGQEIDPEQYKDYVFLNVGSDLYTIGFGLKATSSDGSQVVNKPAPSTLTNTDSNFLQLHHSPTMQQNVQSFSVYFAGLNPETEYTVEPVLVDIVFNGTNSILSTTNAPQLKVTTLEDDGVNQPSNTQDLGGQTGLEASLDHDFACNGITDLLTDCMLQFMYYVVYTGTAGLVYVAGGLFDVLTSLAISSKVYRDSTFVITGWSVVRDISNIFFIFVLLIAAFRLMFGENVGSTIKNVIVVALLINFSLFMVRVVVDSTNILAHIFYGRIADVASISDANYGVENTGGVHYDLSESISQGLQLQNFLAGPNADRFLAELRVNFGTILLLILFGIIVNVMAAWMFFKVGWLMLGRIVGLWVTMILAPLAFVLKLIPGAATYVEGLSFQKWMSDGIKYALMAPVFLFFVYLIILFINSDFLGGFLNESSYESYERLILVSLSFLIILGLLQQATKMAEKMAGEAGNMIAGGAAKALGMAAGVVGGAALATTGLAARQVLGRAGAAIASSERLKDAESNPDGNWLSRGLAARTRDLGKFGESSSFDARGLVGKGLGALGVKGVNLDNAAVGALGGSVKNAQGGFKKAREEVSKNRQERAKDLAVGPDSQLALDVYDARNTERRANSNLETMKAHYGEDHDRTRDAQLEYNNAKQELDRREGRMKRVTNQRKLDYADVVEKEDLMHGFRSGASETADKIRKETGGKGKLQQIEELLGVPPAGGGGTPPTPPAGGGGTPPPGTGGPTASTGQTPQGAVQQPLPGGNQNIERVLEATKPGSATEARGGVNINSGEGKRNVIGGFGQGLQEMQEAKRRAAHEDTQERLATEKTESTAEEPKTKMEYRDVPEVTQNVGETTDTKDFRVAMAEMNATKEGGATGSTVEPESKTTRNQNTEQSETEAKTISQETSSTETQEPTPQPKQEPTTVKIDSEQVKEAFGDMQSTLNSIEEGIGEVGENLGAVGEGLGSVAENFGEGMKATTEATTEAGDKMTAAVETASEKERFRDMKGGSKQSADFKKMAQEIKNLKNSVDKQGNNQQRRGGTGEARPPFDNAA